MDTTAFPGTGDDPGLASVLTSWHTQHFGGFPVDYEVSVYEQVHGMGDQAIVDYTAPLLRQSTPGLAYLYQADDPPSK